MSHFGTGCVAKVDLTYKSSFRLKFHFAILMWRSCGLCFFTTVSGGLWQTEFKLGQSPSELSAFECLLQYHRAANFHTLGLKCPFSQTLPVADQTNIECISFPLTLLTAGGESICTTKSMSETNTITASSPSLWTVRCFLLFSFCFAPVDLMFF